MHDNTTNTKLTPGNELTASTDNFNHHRFSVAPMLDWTDRHCRYFHRLLTKEALLYTEMVTTGALIYGKGDYLAYSEEEHPVALQLGGNEPAALPIVQKWLSKVVMMRLI